MKAVRFWRSVEEPTGTKGVSSMKLCCVDPGGWARMYWGCSRGTGAGTNCPLLPTIGLQQRAARRQLPAAGIGGHRPGLGLGVEVGGIGQVVPAVHVGLHPEDVLRVAEVGRDARE